MAKKLTHISSPVANLTKDIFEKQGIYIIKLVEDWGIIMEESISKSCIPVKISWDSNNKGTLHLFAQNNIVKQVLIHKTKEIIEKVNSYFGYTFIISVRII